MELVIGLVVGLIVGAGLACIVFFRYATSPQRSATYATGYVTSAGGGSMSMNITNASTTFKSGDEVRCVPASSAGGR